VGLEVAIGAAIAATSVVTGVMQYGQAKKADAARKEANEISSAQAKNDNAASRRKAIREARLRRAQIMQSAENTGVGNGSGEAGALGVIGTNLGSNVATASGQTKAITGINAANQKAANYEFKGAQAGAFGNIFSSALTGFQTPTKSG
jgi:hypothetical protein